MPVFLPIMNNHGLYTMENQVGVGLGWHNNGRARRPGAGIGTHKNTQAGETGIWRN
jgi:hypothetical protein